MSCPYNVTQNTPNKPTSAALQLAKTSCPAFKDGTCPFRDANTSDELKEKLCAIPPSHDADDGIIKTNFKLALEHMHRVGTSDEIYQKDDSKKYLLNGGCPFKERGEFRDAMETFSLMAIIGEMATEMHNQATSIIGQMAIESHVRSSPTATAPVSSDHKTTPCPVRRDSLSHSLKTGTAKSHRAAENVHFVRNFIRGKIERHLYSHLVASLYGIYSVLEEELDKNAPRFFPTLHHPIQLSRTRTLERDMAFFFGETEWKSVKPTAATIDYQNRIREIARANPLLLLAHAYTRYLGDLSGGRVLQRVAKKAMNLSSKDGLSFYDFEDILDPKAFKKAYRTALDDLPLGDTDVEKLVGEANVAFVLNMRLFEELDVMAGVEGAHVRPLKEALSFAAGAKESDGDGKCPFANMKALPEVKVKGGGMCPWPFLLLHDFKQGMRKIQTWMVIGILLGFVFGRDLKEFAFILAFVIITWYFFARVHKQSKAAEKTCPWPFVFAHDPRAGMKCFQTWVVIGVLSSWIFNKCNALLVS